MRGADPREGGGLAPRLIAWEQHALPQDAEYALGAEATDAGLYQIRVDGPGQEVPRPSRYVTSPQFVDSVLSRTVRFPRRPTGLMNEAVVCYMNACLQLLRFSTGMAKLIYSPAYRVLLKDSQAAGALFSVLDYMQTGGKVVSPRAFSKVLPLFGMSSHRMGDSYELLIMLLQSLSEAEVAAQGAEDFKGADRETTAIDQIVCTVLRNVTRCLRCGRTSMSYTTARATLLPLASSLYRSLGSYLKGGEVEGYNCAGCGQKATVVRSTEICHAGQTVLFTLSRWTFNKRKCNSPVRLPEGLALGGPAVTAEECLRLAEEDSHDRKRAMAGLGAQAGSFKGKHRASSQKGRAGERVSKSAAILMKLSQAGAASSEASEDKPAITHRLAAVICHQGISLATGHYVTFVRNPSTDMWFQCDDSTVVDVKQEEVLQGNDAYVLVYERIPQKASRASSAAKKGKSRKSEALPGEAHDSEAAGGAPFQSPAGTARIQLLVGMEEPPEPSAVRGLESTEGWLDIGSATAVGPADQEESVPASPKGKRGSRSPSSRRADLEVAKPSIAAESGKAEKAGKLAKLEKQEKASKPSKVAKSVESEKPLKSLRSSAPAKAQRASEQLESFSRSPSPSASSSSSQSFSRSSTPYSSRSSSSSSSYSPSPSDSDRAPRAESAPGSPSLRPPRTRSGSSSKLADPASALATPAPASVSALPGRFQVSTEAWDAAAERRLRAVSSARSDGGSLSLVSPLLHTGPREDDRLMDLGRRRKTQADRDRNYAERQREIAKRKARRGKEWNMKQAARLARLTHLAKHSSGSAHSTRQGQSSKASRGRQKK